MKIEEKLAISCRILSREGHEDLDLGHMSARKVDQDNAMYINCRGVCLSEMRAEDFDIANFNYQVLSSDRSLRIESALHVEIYKARPDIHCVIHTHPLYATAFAASGNLLKPVNNIAALFVKPLPYFDLTSHMIATPELGAALAEKLGDENVVLLKNHGVVVAAETIEKATIIACFLERACKSYFIAKSFGDINVTEKDKKEAEEKAKQIEKSYTRMWETLARLCNQK
ncbi:class II aldolase/adducin family protein [Candidatus Formimonas warabiya]|uniref:Class II aldolase/adducin N-terminal domain-containing protein n=1 Tax=Formimonas warabiya TaxID=1761012 RepID=A0A3G1KMN7_FORW1|nr:class II aldolase/adducin family protein [Candidatus Formimonas warabiya]ATW23721.1 hypothetical protein DCMF_01955 [Candidatus Formimonas warabiya]